MDRGNLVALCDGESIRDIAKSNDLWFSNSTGH
ncbi:Uncharacterised protein [Acinetobacter baumannii]|nr:Uncharacterised protein [Acinetobacter baumannii]